MNDLQLPGRRALFMLPFSASTPQVLETVTNGLENMGGMHV